MEQSPSWEANPFSASQEIPYILRNQKVHHRIDMRPPPILILSQINPVHAYHSTSWRSILILYYHLRLDLPSGIQPPGIPLIHNLALLPLKEPPLSLMIGDWLGPSADHNSVEREKYLTLPEIETPFFDYRTPSLVYRRVPRLLHR
jgi:hypothetical protein